WADGKKTFARGGASCLLVAAAVETAPAAEAGSPAERRACADRDGAAVTGLRVSMHRFSVLLLFLLIPAAAQEYPHRVSLSFGGMNPVAGWQAEAFDGAPLLSFDYGYRFNRYGQFDAGVDTAFATEE